MPTSTPASPPLLRQKDILWFWLPLLASWMLMLAEGPIISATINRLPERVTMLAAQGIVVSLSVMIESPIINLLATATAVVRDRATFRLVQRFTLQWMALLTLITALVAFTPLFDVVVRQLLGTPDAIAVWVRPGLRIMTLWSAAIAWRRFLQGVLIAFDQTSKVARGTAVRLVAAGGGALLLWQTVDWPGVYIGATALMAGVLAEAVYATLAVRPVWRDLMPEDAGGAALTYRQLTAFHLPLAGTSVLVLLAQPLVQATVARLNDAELTLAAWPLVFQLLLFMRAMAMALPEAVIALSKRRGAFVPLRRFSLVVSGATLAFMLLLVLTPLARYYLFDVQNADPRVGAIALRGVLYFLPLPALNVLVSWLRGVLINRGTTTVVNLGMAVNLTVTGLVLLGALLLRWPGILGAALALTLALVGELLYLQWATQRLLSEPLWPHLLRRSAPAGHAP